MLMNRWFVEAEFNSDSNHPRPWTRRVTKPPDQSSPQVDPATHDSSHRRPPPNWLLEPPQRAIKGNIAPSPPTMRRRPIGVHWDATHPQARHDPCSPAPSTRGCTEIQGHLPSIRVVRHHIRESEKGLLKYEYSQCPNKVPSRLQRAPSSYGIFTFPRPTRLRPQPHKSWDCLLKRRSTQQATMQPWVLCLANRPATARASQRRGGIRTNPLCRRTKFS